MVGVIVQTDTQDFSCKGNYKLFYPFLEDQSWHVVRKSHLGVVWFFFPFMFQFPDLWHSVSVLTF